MEIYYLISKFLLLLYDTRIRSVIDDDDDDDDDDVDIYDHTSSSSSEEINIYI